MWFDTKLLISTEHQFMWYKNKISLSSHKTSVCKSVNDVICHRQWKKPMMVILSLGACGGKLHPAFRELAEFTSGQVVLLKSAKELEKLANVTRGALEGTTIISLGSSESGRKKRTSGGLRRYRFPVDDSIETVTISVKTNQPDTNGLWSRLFLPSFHTSHLQFWWYLADKVFVPAC